MSLDVYFRDDLTRILRSLCVVAAATVSSPEEARGFALAVRAMAEALALSVSRELGTLEATPPATSLSRLKQEP